MFLVQLASHESRVPFFLASGHQCAQCHGVIEFYSLPSNLTISQRFPYSQCRNVFLDVLPFLWEVLQWSISFVSSHAVVCLELFCSSHFGLRSPSPQLLPFHSNSALSGPMRHSRLRLAFSNRGLLRMRPKGVEQCPRSTSCLLTGPLAPLNENLLGLIHLLISKFHLRNMSILVIQSLEIMSTYVALKDRPQNEPCHELGVDDEAFDNRLIALQKHRLSDCTFNLLP